MDSSENFGGGRKHRNEIYQELAINQIGIGGQEYDGFTLKRVPTWKAEPIYKGHEGPSPARITLELEYAGRPITLKFSSDSAGGRFVASSLETPPTLVEIRDGVQ